MVKYSEKGTAHPCPFLKNYAFLRLYFTAFALQSSRTEGVRTSVELFGPGIVIPLIPFALLWLRPAFPGASASFLTKSAHFSHSFQYYDYSLFVSFIVPVVTPISLPELPTYIPPAS